MYPTHNEALGTDTAWSEFAEFVIQARKRPSRRVLVLSCRLAAAFLIGQLLVVARLLHDIHRKQKCSVAFVEAFLCTTPQLSLKAARLMCQYLKTGEKTDASKA